MAVLRLRWPAPARAGGPPPAAAWAVLADGAVCAVFPRLCEARWFAAEFCAPHRAEIRPVPLDTAP